MDAPSTDVIYGYPSPFLEHYRSIICLFHMYILKNFAKQNFLKCIKQAYDRSLMLKTGFKLVFYGCPASDVIYGWPPTKMSFVLVPLLRFREH